MKARSAKAAAWLLPISVVLWCSISFSSWRNVIKGQRDSAREARPEEDDGHAEFLSNIPETGVAVTKVSAATSFLYGYISKDADSFQIADPAIRTLEPGLSALWVNRTRACCEANGHVIDVGGHFGYYSLLSAALGCTFTAFEPVPTFSSVFKMNMAINKLGPPHDQLVKAAVGSAPGTVDMIVPTSGVLGLARIKGHHKDMDPTSDLSLSVPLVRLDDVAFADEIPICAMKIDVEGHEPAVIDGASKLLSTRRVPNIMLEFSPGYTIDGLEAMLAQLHAWGYKAMEIDWGLAKIGKAPMDVSMDSFGPNLARDISSVDARSHFIQSVGINTNVWFYL